MKCSQLQNRGTFLNMRIVFKANKKGNNLAIIPYCETTECLTFEKNN